MTATPDAAEGRRAHPDQSPAARQDRLPQIRTGRRRRDAPPGAELVDAVEKLVVCLGVGQDHAKAVQWYQRAAEQGYAAAQHNLGFMYLAGRGVAQDTLRAHMWFDLASRRGLEAAREGRDAAASELTPDQIAEAQRLVREWKPVAER